MRKIPHSKIRHIEMCQKSGKVAPVYGIQNVQPCSCYLKIITL